MGHYNLDHVRVQIRKDISETEALLHSWEIVSIRTTKEGKPFKNMRLNFRNATYSKIVYMPDSVPELRVYTFTSDKKYIDDAIRCYHSDFTLMTLDEIKNEIAKRIEQLARKLKALKNDESILDSAYESYKKDLTEAYENLRKNTNADVDETLCFYLFYLFRDRFPYC